MMNLSIHEIKKRYWQVQTFHQKHRTAHLAAEIYYCAHMFMGILILLMKLEYFYNRSDLFVNPPLWLGVLFPLLTVGTYNLGVLSVVGTLLCFVLIPALGALLVYWLFSTPFFKRYPSKKNPYQNVRNSEMFEQCAAIKQKGADAVGVLKHRIHKVVWIQVLCFAVLFVLLMISGLTQGTIKPEEFGTGLVTILLVAPAYSIVLYLLRWIEGRLFVPLDRLFGAICRARMKKPLGEITESALYEQHFADVNRKYQAKIEREKREKLQKERKRKEYERIAAEHVKNAPVFIDDVMRAVQKSESKSTSDSNPDPLGLRDGVHVDPTGI